VEDVERGAIGASGDDERIIGLDKGIMHNSPGPDVTLAPNEIPTWVQASDHRTGGVHVDASQKITTGQFLDELETSGPNDPLRPDRGEIFFNPEGKEILLTAPGDGAKVVRDI